MGIQGITGDWNVQLALVLGICEVPASFFLDSDSADRARGVEKKLGEGEGWSLLMFRGFTAWPLGRLPRLALA